MNDDTLTALDRLIDKNDTATSQQLATALQRKTRKRVSPRTIRRVRCGPLARHHVRTVITKSLGEAEKERRVSFAQKLLTMNLHYVLWSDEKQWQLDSTGQVHWVKKGAQIPTREVKVINASVMVWGCVWYSGKSELCVCERNIDAEYYTQILADYLLPCMPDSSRYKFMQDNAPAHKAKKTKNWLAQFDVPVLEDWPSNSPDLNPIEHVWSWMTTYVQKEAPTDKVRESNFISLGRSTAKCDSGLHRSFKRCVPSNHRSQGGSYLIHSWALVVYTLVNMSLQSTPSPFHNFTHVGTTFWPGAE